MEGRIELEWNGREITIERRSKGRVPMGEFQAYETESGLPVRELTAENCGLQLLGVERAVYERSAFVRQAGQAVTQDGALERRLGALVTTGEETVSYSDTERRLRDWKNACRHNQTGELPRLERQLEDTERTLEQIRMLQERTVSLRAGEEPRNAELLRLSRVEKALRAAENRRKQEAVARAEGRCAELRVQADAALELTAGLPKEPVLRQWQKEWAELQNAWRTIPIAAMQNPEHPVVPSVFAGKTAEEILETAEAAERSCEKLEQEAQPVKQPFPWLAIAALVLAAVVFLLPTWYLGFVFLAFAAMMAVMAQGKATASRRKAEQAALELQSILQRFGAASQSEIRRLAERTVAELGRYEEACIRLQEEESRRLAAAEALRQREAGYFAKLKAAIPDAEEPVAALDAAIAAQRTADRLSADVEAAKRHCRELAETLQPTEAETAPDMDVSGYDLQAVEQRKSQLQWELQELRTQLDRIQGQISAMGDPAELEARREQLAEQIAEQKRRYDALTTAMAVLEQANDSLQTRFAPEISRRAEAVMAELTDSRYDRILLDRALTITARETGEVTSRELNRLSAGTADQLYLAVRLAICGAVLGEDVPLILDDALVNFDDARLLRAMQLLRNEGRNRQILLFTCQSREKNCLS